MALRKKTVFRGTGQRLTIFREQQKLSKMDLANRLGLNHSGYYKNENGETLPGFLTLYKLKDQFDLSIDWFLFGVEPMYLGEKTAAEKHKHEALTKELEKTKEELAKSNTELQAFSGLEGAAPEIKELLHLMQQDPQFKHEILGHLYKFKKENSIDNLSEP